MQSSYSRIFGLLDGRARWLYVANANEAREEFFDLRGARSRPVHSATPNDCNTVNGSSIGLPG
jgi:hypothetical protein